MNTARCALAAALIASLILAACGGEKKTATQVAARVNQEEISVHQINAVLSRSGNLPPEQAKEAGKQALERLIDQELMVQKAVDKKLDRDPKVMQSIEMAKRQILAQAYLEQVAVAAAKPSAEDIKAFYGKHPELFAERRIYRFQETTLNLKPESLAELREQMKGAKSSEDIFKWLREKKVPFNTSTVTKAAEQLPLEMAPNFHQMKDGQIGVLQGQGGMMLVQLLASQQQPMDERTATPVIEQFLGNQKKMEAAQQERKQLRDGAKIEYLGDFTAPAKEAVKEAAKEGTKEAATGPANAAVAQAAPPAPAAAPQPKAEAKAGAGKLDSDSLAKGLSGLK